MSHRTRRLSAVCAVVMLSLVAGCGAESSNAPDVGAATDTSSPTPDTSSETPMSDPTSDGSSGSTDTGAGGVVPVGATLGPQQAVIVKASNVDGEAAVRASALVDAAAVDTFLAKTDARLADPVRAAVDSAVVPEDHTLFGAVVFVGCETPTEITWSTTFDGIEVTPTVPKPGVNCLVPVTSVALFLVPDVV